MKFHFCLVLLPAALLSGSHTSFAAPAPERRTIADLGVTMLPIPAGTFLLGTAGTTGDESPQTRVTISKPFWLGETEVTVAQWRKFRDATGYKTEAELTDGIFLRTALAMSYEKQPGTSWRKLNFAQEDSHPVVGISWNDAQRFCAWLTERERAADRLPAGYAYTLPTEAQWEYACRAGTVGADAGNEGDVAWFAGNSERQTRPVGRKQPNAWGLFDMRGSAWEWCLDWYGKYPGGEVTDPQGPPTGTIRTSRGGAWNSAGGHGISSTNRWNIPNLDRRNNLGFRLALSTR